MSIDYKTGMGNLCFKFINMKKKLLNAILLASSLSCFGQWTNLNAPTSNTSFFYTYQDIAVSDNGKNIATWCQKIQLSPYQVSTEYITSHDNGSTWQEYPAPSLPDLDMFWDGDTLYVQEAGNQNQLKRSTNFGQSFTVQNNSYNTNSTVLRSPNGNWYLNYSSHTYYSHNKGATWALDPNTSLLAPSFNYYVVVPSGRIHTAASSVVAYSDDGGDHWTASSFPIGFTGFGAGTFISAATSGNLIYLSSSSPDAYLSTDLGASYQKITGSNLASNVKYLDYIGNEIVAFYANGATYKSVDNGITYTQITASGNVSSGTGKMKPYPSGLYIAGDKGVFRYNSATGIKTYEATYADFSVYPNPCNDQLNIALKNTKDCEVTILDLMGNELIKTRKSTIDVSEFKNGIYFVRVGNRSLKIIKE